MAKEEKYILPAIHSLSDPGEEQKQKHNILDYGKKRLQAGSGTNI